jgi:hypothetical protein
VFQSDGVEREERGADVGSRGREVGRQQCMCTRLEVEIDTYILLYITQLLAHATGRVGGASERKL